MDEMREMREARAITAPASQSMEAKASVITKETLHKWERKLNEYKAGKASIDRRIQTAEKWWKLRNVEMVRSETDPKAGGFRSATAWLHNVLVNKHADAIEAFPMPNFLPREEGDKIEAWALSQIVPAVLAQNDYESVYDERIWRKLKTGTGCTKVVWDSRKHNGLGDISINCVDILNLFWEPGIKDIQASDMVFHVEMVDKERLVERYPQLKDKGLAASFRPNEQPVDDNVNMADKAAVVDAYYHKGGALHLCKYVGDEVLYASEDDPSKSKGYYEHGLYPFVFDVLFPVEGSPCGYGYIDVCRNSQTAIDLMDTAILRNTISSATPRVIMRSDGGINEDEYVDIEKAVIHATGNLGEDSVRVLETKNLSGNYINALNNKINELRETSGNTETATGVAPSGVTAASAIAALQEASGKGSRASTLTSYRASRQEAKLVMELIRQFYDQPRQFRITGNMGIQRFISFDNRFMRPQPQGMMGGMDLGVRVPEYDIEIVPEKANRYTKLSQNELAKELYGLGLFAPQNAEMALMCLEMMDFDGKDELMQKLSAKGMMFQQQQMLMMQMGMQAQRQQLPPKGREEEDKRKPGEEIKQVQDARQRANEEAMPG